MVTHYRRTLAQNLFKKNVSGSILIQELVDNFERHRRHSLTGVEHSAAHGSQPRRRWKWGIRMGKGAHGTN